MVVVVNILFGKFNSGTPSYKKALEQQDQMLASMLSRPRDHPSLVMIALLKSWPAACSTSVVQHFNYRTRELVCMQTLIACFIWSAHTEKNSSYLE